MATPAELRTHKRQRNSGKLFFISKSSSSAQQSDVYVRSKIRNEYASRTSSKLDAYDIHMVSHIPIVEFGEGLLDGISEELEEDEEPYIFYSSDNNLNVLPSVHIQSHIIPTSSLTTSPRQRRLSSSLYSIPEED